MAVISLLYVFVPGIFLRSFFLQGAAASAASASVAAMAAVLLRFVAGYNLLDATQLVFVGALKGAGDTRFLLRVSVLAGGAIGRVQLPQRRGVALERLPMLDADCVLVLDRGGDVRRAILAGKVAADARHRSSGYRRMRRAKNAGKPGSLQATKRTSVYCRRPLILELSWRSR